MPTPNLTVAASLSVLGVLSALASTTLGDEPAYLLTELDTAGGSFSTAFGINAHGIVAGRVAGIGAVLWDETGLVPLGHPGGELSIEARAVNAAGAVACVGEGSPQTYQSFLRTSDAWTPMGSLSGLPDTIVQDIDAAGRIVGWSLVVGPGAPDRAFVWDAGVFTELGTLGESARAHGMNDLGQVVGISLAHLPDGEPALRGFLWEDGLMRAIEPLPGDVATQAFDINDAGDIVGSSWTYTTSFFTVDQATLWRNGGEEAVDLGRVPAAPGSCSFNPYWHKSIARAVNNRGQVVGEAMCITSGAPKAAFIWQDGVMRNLGDLVAADTGLDLRSARDINDAGQIVGYGINDAGEVRAFLLTPLASCPADLDDDGAVTVTDLLAVLAAWGPCGSCGEDLDGDGAVTVTDLLAVLAAWGPCR